MKIQNQYINPNFRAGLTSAMRSEIRSVDAAKVSEALQKQGIQSDFKGNKMLAWCSLKSVEIINEINKRFGAKLGLPKGVFVEDFSQQSFLDKDSLGFINLVPTKKYGTNDVTPEKTIFFNEFSEFNYQGGNHFWEKLNECAEMMFETGNATSDFFLEPVFHEFAHAMHESNLIKNLKPQKVLEFLFTIAKNENVQAFQERNGGILSRRICNYAATGPHEAVACDLTKRTIANLDKELLVPNENFVAESPYQRRSFWDRHIGIKPESKLTVILRDFWNGKIPEYFSRVDMKNIKLQ